MGDKYSSFLKILVRVPLSNLKGKEIKSAKLFNEGLYLSSPELWSESQKIDKLEKKERNKIEKTLLKYHIRSSSRCTPYATFAGFFVATESESTEIIRNQEFSQFVRIDANFISQIISFLELHQSIKHQLNYSLNNSLYPFADGFRYTEFSSHNNMKRYHLSEIERTNCIDYWYNQQQIKSYKDYIEDIEKMESVSSEEAIAFFDHLIYNQILISELEPCVTGVEPLNQLISIVSKLEGINEIQQILSDLFSFIQNPKFEVAYYQSIENKVKKLVPNLTMPKNTLQVDMMINTTEAKLDAKVISMLKSQVSDMMSFNRSVTNQNLDDFKREFNKKYENQKLPLALVLDNEAGIGFAGIGNSGDNSLVENLFIASPSQSSGSNIKHDYITDFTKKKYLEWAKTESSFITITEEDIKPFLANKNRQFATSMSLFGAFQKKNNEFNKDNFQFELNSLGGPSGANLLGRFAMGSKEVEEMCREIVKNEEENYPDIIFAEIAHLPEARMGNILLRPCFRDYEIAYIGKSGLPLDKQIGIMDLLVYIEYGQIILWSQKHNKRVIPRLSTAHNFSRGLPIYKFLCELQMQGLSYSCVWDWGVFSNEKYLPRVVYKNIVWQKARWIIEEKDIKELPKEKNTWLDFLVQFRKDHKLPARILYSQGDNNLLIDFENLGMVEILIDYIKKYKKITLIEFLFDETNCIVEDEEGNPYTNEVIIPFEYKREDGK